MRGERTSAIRLGVAITLLVSWSATPVRAVTAQWASPELRPSVGVYVPTGPHDDLLERGPVFGGQVAVELRPALHAVFGFGWVATEERQATPTRRIEMAQFDLGVEWLRHDRDRRELRMTPFLGGGIGLRAYRSRDADAPSQANVAGYGALGIEIGTGAVGVRLEGRDYLTAFRGLDGADGTSLRNDVMVVVGVGLRLR
ncbi:MAG TPA: hypothetical protein VFZ21_25630 [Gemmatimonadaceae bacterium]|jgi:hypothetical protein|nr:hypothetical protein [Gemmatimonadaceae bacterium]